MEVRRWISVAMSLAAAALLLTTVPVVAHHSSAAAYDNTKKVEHQGTVTKVLLKNPHGFVYLDSTDEKGQKIEVVIEMGGATGMVRQGWTKDTLPIGSVVKVSGIPSRAPGSHGITEAKFTAPDGTPIAPTPRPEYTDR